MKTRTWYGLALSLALVLCCGALVAGWLWHRSPNAVQLPRSCGWQPGIEYTYKVRWEASQDVLLAAGTAPGGGSLGAKADIGGELVVRGVRREGNHTLVAMHLQNVDRHYFKMFDQDWLVEPDAAKEQLEGRELLAEFDRSGKLVRIHRKPDENPLLVSLMQSMLLRAQMSCPDQAAATWNAVESTTTGVSQVVYSIQSQTPTVLRRTRTRYDVIQGLKSTKNDQERQELDAMATIELDATGAPTKLTDKEQLTVLRGNAQTPALKSSSDLDWTAVSTVPARDEPAIAMNDWVAVAPGELIDNQEQTERKLLEQRIGGMTLQDMVAGIELFSAAGMVPDQARWMSRVTGLLRLHPEYCASMAALFEQEGMTTDGRALIADLLASVGHAEAQAALRDVLGSESAKQDKAYPLLVQRFLFVHDPTTESLAFLEARMLEERPRGGDALHAYANALANAAGEASKHGKPEAAAYGQKVVDMLRNAREPEDQKAYLAALGNASMPEHVSTIRDYAGSSEPMVRSAAAYALRNATDSESRSTLIGLTQDQERLVAESALSGLDQQELEPGEVNRLAKLVLSGDTSPASDGHMVTLLMRYTGRSQLVTQALVALLARNQDNPQIASRIVAALQAQGG